MTEFIMLVGLPGSGKSTCAEKLKKEGYMIHSSDAIREELTGDVNSQENNFEVFDILHKRVKEDLKSGHSSVYDATNMSRKRRKAFLDEISKVNCRKICVLFVIPVELCKERNERRERKIPDEVYDRMLKAFFVPAYYEGWDEIRIVTVRRNPYPFVYESMIGFSQDNSHHSLDLFDHCFETYKYAHQKNFPFEVQCAAKYHDCGKMYTKTFIDTKGNETEEAHYYGHENYSAYIFLVNSFTGCDVILSYERGNSNKYLYIAALINWHMRPYTSWKQSEKSLRRDKELIGEKMYEDIMMLHEADVAAHS